MALDGRWCKCGGETRYARRVEKGEIVSYLLCLFCRRKVRMLEYRMADGRHYLPGKEEPIG